VWWSEMWAQRVTESEFARIARATGRADAAQLARLAQGWLAWGADQDGWLTIPHGEILCRG